MPRTPRCPSDGDLLGAFGFLPLVDGLIETTVRSWWTDPGTTAAPEGDAAAVERVRRELAARRKRSRAAFGHEPIRR